MDLQNNPFPDRNPEQSDGWHKVCQDSVKALVLTITITAIILVTANNPSADDAVRGLTAGVVGSLLAQLSKAFG